MTTHMTLVSHLHHVGHVYRQLFDLTTQLAHVKNELILEAAIFHTLYVGQKRHRTFDKSAILERLYSKSGSLESILGLFLEDRGRDANR